MSALRSSGQPIAARRTHSRRLDVATRVSTPPPYATARVATAPSRMLATRRSVGPGRHTLRFHRAISRSRMAAPSTDHASTRRTHAVTTAMRSSLASDSATRSSRREPVSRLRGNDGSAGFGAVSNASSYPFFTSRRRRAVPCWKTLTPRTPVATRRRTIRSVGCLQAMRWSSRRFSAPISSAFGLSGRCAK